MPGGWRQARCRQRHVRGARDPERLAVVDRLDRGQLVGVLEDQIADPPDQPPAFSRGQTAPVGILERVPSGRDGDVDVLCITGWDVVDHFTQSGVVHLEGSAVTGLDPLAVDQHPLGLPEKMRGG